MNANALLLDQKTAFQEFEKFQLGHVESGEQKQPADFGIPQELAPSEIWEVNVTDPYLEVIPEAISTQVKNWEEIGDDFAKLRRECGYWDRRADTVYTDASGNLVEGKKEWGDPVSKEYFFSKLGNQAFDDWRSLIPSSVSLAYLSDPLAFDYIYRADGHKLAQIDDVARAWLIGCTDAIGIRSRASVLSEIVRGYVESKVDEASSLKWMSVACGTALPAMKAAVNAHIKPELLLVDVDRTAMDATEELSKAIGFEGCINQRWMNIFNDKKTAKLAEELGQNGGRPRIIDMMGIFEYTGENIKVDPASFLKSYYEMLSPGGKLIFGQMRGDRPNIDFTMGVIGWPYVYMRSPKEVMEIITQAGIGPQQVKLYLPEDGVYTVVTIDKPAMGVGEFTKLAA
jgi:hypothetical protein